jgi:hypothetical protein
VTAENFVFWLNGYFELGGENLSPQQVQIIKDHLALVFNKVTPSYDLGETTIPQIQTYAESQKAYTGIYVVTSTGENPRFYGYSPNSQMYPPLSNQQFVSC